MHIREINIKNRVCNYYFDNLVQVKELETKNILIDENTIKTCWFINKIYLQQVNNGKG